MANRVLTELKSLGSDIKMQAVELPKSVISNIPKQILGTSGQGQKKPLPVINPPTDQEIVDQLYGITEQKASQEKIAQEDNEAVQKARNKERMRQMLLVMLQNHQKEPSPEEKDKIEEQQQQEVRVEQQKGQLPELIQPSSAPQKGKFGAGNRKKGHKQQISDLQTGAERKMPGSGVA